MKIHHIAITVNNLKESENFTRKLLVLLGLLPNSVFDEFFPILAETPLEKTHKYGVLISFFQKVVGKIGENWRKSGLGSSPLLERRSLLKKKLVAGPCYWN